MGYVQIDPNVSTFTPLDQQVKSNIKYTGNGFIPCEGYVEIQLQFSCVTLDFCNFPTILVTYRATKTTLEDESRI